MENTHQIHSILIEHIEKLSIPESFERAKSDIYNQYIKLASLIKNPHEHKIYGVNTLVGHMDEFSLNEEEAQAFQENLINNHAISSSDKFYDSYTVRCISYARVWLYSLGGGGISPQLYEILLKTIVASDFSAKIPVDLSYSCGDVIPGANWAKSLMSYISNKYNYKLKPKEGLSLINSSFIHIGVGLAGIKEIEVLKNAVYEVSKINAEICTANASNYTEFLTDNKKDALKDISAFFRMNTQLKNDYNIQDPISIRSFPQTLAAFQFALKNYYEALEIILQRRSDNPLISENYPNSLSQGSFVAPELSLATGQLIDAMLMIAWNVERRVHHVLSGKIAGIPINFSQSNSDLGLIQIPKMLSGILEKMRLLAGRRTFASGSSTSYGIEDFWTLGVLNSNLLKETTKDLFRMITIEVAIYSEITQQNRKDLLKKYSILNQLTVDYLNINYKKLEGIVFENYNNAD